MHCINFIYFFFSFISRHWEVYAEIVRHLERETMKVTNSIYNNKTRRERKYIRERGRRHASLFNNMTMRSLNLPESFNYTLLLTQFQFTRHSLFFHCISPSILQHYCRLNEWWDESQGGGDVIIMQMTINLGSSWIICNFILLFCGLRNAICGNFLKSTGAYKFFVVGKG